MRCSRCGTELLPGKKFCVSCGAPAEVPCPNCGAAVEPGWRFCPDCGRELPFGPAPAVLAPPPPASEPPPPAPPTQAPEQVANEAPLSRLSRPIPETLPRPNRAPGGAAG